MLQYERGDRKQSQLPDSGDILTLLSHHHPNHQSLTACPGLKTAQQNRDDRHTHYHLHKLLLYSRMGRHPVHCSITGTHGREADSSHTKEANKAGLGEKERMTNEWLD